MLEKQQTSRVTYIQNLCRSVWKRKLEGCSGTTRRARMALTFYLTELNLQMAHLLLMENNCANFCLNPPKIAGVMVRTKKGPSRVTLTLGLPERMFQMAHLHVIENNCVKLFEIHLQFVKVVVRTNLDGRTHARTYTELTRHNSADSVPTSNLVCIKEVAIRTTFCCWNNLLHLQLNY